MSCRRIAFATLAVLSLGALPARTEGPASLATLELGRGATVVLVHDLGGRRQVWMPLAKHLLKTHRLVLVDLPGHGESAMLDPFSLEAAARALDQVVARHKPESTVVVGHGLGGLVALMGAAAHPERLRGLVLVGAAAKLGVPDQHKRAFLQFLDERYDTFLAAMFKQLGRDSAQGVAIHAEAAQVPAATIKAYLKEVLYADASIAAKKLARPVLFVAGDRQWAAGKSAADVAKESGLDGLPKLTLRRIGQSGHYVMSDQPDSLARAIAEFSTGVITAP